jgi:hypothetical protein
MVCFRKYLKFEEKPVAVVVDDSIPCLGCKVWKNTARYCRIVRFFKRCDAKWGFCAYATGCVVNKVHVLRCVGCKKLSEVGN